MSKSIYVRQSYSKAKVGRFLRHSVECCLLTLTGGVFFIVIFVLFM